MAKKYLKSGVRVGTRTFVVGGGLVLAWLNLGMPTSLDGLLPALLTKSATATVVALVTILAAALDSVPGERVKASLVFLRWKHPLPGSRAFERKNLACDTRIDPERLRAFLGGVFPRSPAQQNAIWYRLYKTVEEDPRVEGAQFDYLQFRDLAWFSVLLLIASVIGAVANSTARSASFWSALAFLVLTVIFSRAARERGHRFVNTVLALSSLASPTKEI